jgi:MerR family transcriptional regulator, light-induced transcriptional regulator
VRETIRRVRASAQGPDVLILVGGYPFNIDRDLWRKIGADGNAEDAASALQLAGELLKD